MNTFVLLAMIFCHIFDDFFLQPAWLVNGKQKSWWQKNAPEKLYSSDYILCLVAHGFSWTFMTMLPIAIFFQFQVPGLFTYLLVINAVIHAIIDDLKANRNKINLIEDQSLHLIQIAFIFYMLKGVAV